MQDHAGLLAEVERAVGRPPRRLSKLVRRYGDPLRARGAHPPDPTAKLYDHYRQTLKRGVVRWAAVVQANHTLYAPGRWSSMAQVVYAEDEVSLIETCEIAERTAATKGTMPTDPAVRKVADMLADEMERALDWPLPEALSGGRRAYTTITPVHRATVPDRFMGLGYFPVLADPATKYTAMVPAAYWPEALVEQWRDRTGALLSELDTEAVMEVTPLAAEAAAGIAAEHGFSPFHVRFYLRTDLPDGAVPQIEVTEDPPDTEGCAVYEQHGVTIAVAKVDAIYLRDKRLDYEHLGAGGRYDMSGFVVGRRQA